MILRTLPLLAFFITPALLLAGPTRGRAINDLQRLLAMHQAEMQAVFAGIGSGSPAAPAFFTDVSFLNDRQVESFLLNVSASSQPGQVYSQVSFTRMVAIGGDVRSVSYSLVNDGANVRLVKSSNVNGQLLKAVYDYDVAGRKLKTGAFDGQKTIKNSEYSI
ncbi:MAG TPA: hypothetical protein PKM44_00560 [Turneriella sp.]|nr:hypothetical protein [Turneriella sp.]HNE20901.1 hypothetical protein [Turneriella sp.]HNJ65287.1 hypothetical protein [Turneriella sp.]HNL08970.1 hypothetical protein [Turneriella sp.]HNM99435.1 hypothetical protein [Turneriella sp.]